MEGGGRTWYTPASFLLLLLRFLHRLKLATFQTVLPGPRRVLKLVDRLAHSQCALTHLRLFLKPSFTVGGEKRHRHIGSAPRGLEFCNLPSLLHLILQGCQFLTLINLKGHLDLQSELDPPASLCSQSPLLNVHRQLAVAGDH